MDRSLDELITKDHENALCSFYPESISGVETGQTDLAATSTDSSSSSPSIQCYP